MRRRLTWTRVFPLISGTRIYSITLSIMSRWHNWYNLLGTGNVVVDVSFSAFWLNLGLFSGSFTFFVCYFVCKPFKREFSIQMIYIQKTKKSWKLLPQLVNLLVSQVYEWFLLRSFLRWFFLKELIISKYSWKMVACNCLPWLTQKLHTLTKTTKKY